MTDLTAAISALGTTTRPAKRGPHLETKRLNFYDRVIVEKARLAQGGTRGGPQAGATADRRSLRIGLA